MLVSNLLIAGVVFAGNGIRLSKEELKQFNDDFKILSDAHCARQNQIILKYGPKVLDKFDLIVVSFDTSTIERKRFDSLSNWVRLANYNESRNRLIDSLPYFQPSRKAVAISELSQLSKGNSDPGISSFLYKEIESFSKTSLDTIFSVLQILPTELVEKTSLQKNFNQEIGVLWNNAKNQDENSIIRFARRFPGLKEAELSSAIQSMRMDETSLLIKNPTNRNLIQLYKTLEVGKQRTAIKQKLEKGMYEAWKGSQDPEEAMQAAKDFIEVFKEEPRKSAKFKEIEEWMNPPVNPAQTESVPQPINASLPALPFAVKAN